jgi:hypothetical protein
MDAIFKPQEKVALQCFEKYLAKLFDVDTYRMVKSFTKDRVNDIMDIFVLNQQHYAMSTFILTIWVITL